MLIWCYYKYKEKEEENEQANSDKYCIVRWDQRRGAYQAVRVMKTKGKNRVDKWEGVVIGRLK